MNRLKRLIRIAAGLLSLLAPSLAFAGSTCVFGAQDNTCLTRIVNAPEVASSCSTGAGYQTVTPAVWQGSQWSQPVCSYTAPPTCVSGTSQTTAPTWDGTQWVGQVCTVVSPPETGPVCSYVAGNTYVELLVNQGDQFAKFTEQETIYLVVNGATLWTYNGKVGAAPLNETEINNNLSGYGYQLGTLESTAPYGTDGSLTYDSICTGD